MLAKGQRISRETFKTFSKGKKFFNSENFSLMASSDSTTPKFGVSVSKKVSKEAVVRNRVRRRAYSAIRSFISDVKPGLYLLTAKPSAKSVKGDKLKDELNKLLVVSYKL